MSIPGEGLTKLYRNSLNLVSDFLETKHQGHYLIFNLSGISYNYEKFEGRVKEYPWEDHYPPPIDLLFRACRAIEKWLRKSHKNIIAVNCRAGKGRTGTLISCYLLYSGRFTSAFSALHYYQQKRFKEGGGVTQPSQVRYVYYFYEILQGNVKSPLILRPSTLQFRTAPHMKSDSCRPILEFYYNEKIIYSTKQSDRGSQAFLCDNWEDNRLHTAAVFDPQLFIQGDVLCRLIHWGKFKYTNICRFSFNTGFVPYNKVLVLRKYQLDPYTFRKNLKTSEHFTVLIDFEQMCSCKPDMKISERCEICYMMLSDEEKEKWSKIDKICMKRNIVDPVENLFGSSENDDVEAFTEGLNDTADFELLDIQ
jgi:phosphatidylinositol-3,4,5-trisphosphate 3-phosphatase/dual-specificity protein phosphatase PTEN